VRTFGGSKTLEKKSEYRKCAAEATDLQQAHHQMLTVRCDEAMELEERDGLRNTIAKQVQ
jgi:hypothetical protein